ncbi:MAG TPA: PQQ-binding-like beta-propeller repeat protein [Chloroflexota bacterium]|nr:PQQ-binding-like beta-propeller repeat protein [Chloroflexota bacterium]
MRRLTAILLALLSALALSVTRAADWPMDGHDPAATSYSAQGFTPAQIARLHMAWRRTGFSAINTIVAGRYVYMLANNNGGASRLLVIDAASGRTLRTYTSQSLHLSQPATPIGNGMQDLAYAGGRLVIATIATVLAINPLTGHQYWRVNGGAQGLIIAANIVYTGKGCQNPCGTLASYAINLMTGHVLWTHHGNFGATPTLVLDHLFQGWGEMKGSTRIYDPLSGQLIGSIPYLGLWSGDASHAYVDTGVNIMSGRFHAELESLSPDGHIAWQVNLGRPNEIHPVVAAGTIYVPSDRFHPGMLAVNARNGRILWAADVGSGLQIAAAGRLVYAYSEQHCLLTVLDGRSGRALRAWQPLSCQNGAGGAMILSGNTLYVSNGDGLVAYRP